MTSAHRCETRVKDSRFIASICPVADLKQVKRHLDDLRRDYGDATHHCWSYRIAALPHDLERCSDAGEPAGTAGRPIRQAIEAAGLANVLVVVVRYFGGTKLGRGGLMRAYRGAARQAIAGCRQEMLRLTTRLRLRGPVKGDGEARHLVARHGGTVDLASYEEQGAVVLDVTVPRDAARLLIETLGDQTRGGWNPIVAEGESTAPGDAGEG